LYSLFVIDLGMVFDKRILTLARIIVAAIILIVTYTQNPAYALNIDVNVPNNASLSDQSALQGQAQSNATSADQKRQVTLTVIVDDQGDPPRLMDMLFQPALKELSARHPDLEIHLDYRPIPYLDLREEFSRAMANQTAVDIMTVDHIWLGEFVENGFLTDLTDRAQSWGRQDDWYSANWAGGIYNDQVYGIWTVTDVRGMWYWKDLLQAADVDPNSLKTWDGWISSIKKLDTALSPQGIEGVHLVGAGFILEFYPYLWMQGGEIIRQKEGHPTKGIYWFPAFNGTEGVRALSFIKQQIDAGAEPQKEHFWGKEFLDRKFAVMLEALQNHVHLNTTEQKEAFEQQVGFFPMFPVPSLNNTSSTLLGGWLLGVPQTSQNKDLAWELITIIEEPEIMAPFHAKYGLLPTQIPIGNGPYATDLNNTIPYFDELISMLETARARPNIPEYPQIAENILEAINQVYNGTRQPEEALDQAAAKSAEALGW
jgi:multiple sugar transport system substrate-binding protein